MAYRVRDMTTGLYMDKVVPDGKLTWHETGHIWEQVIDLQTSFGNLQEMQHEVSSLWEVEEMTMTISDRYPAIVHSNKKKKSGRAKS